MAISRERKMMNDIYGTDMPAAMARRALQHEVRMRALAELRKRDAEKFSLDWTKIARPNQLPPAWAWRIWLIMAGRGFGKTRTGAEWVKQQVKTNRYVNLIGATIDDAQDVMVEGESGLMNICPRDERPRHVGRKLKWPNGAISLIFTAEEPERLRGKQHEKLWADELGAWRYADAWDQAMFGLRLGKNPQACVTTTPRPTLLMTRLVKDAQSETPTVALTRGSTYDNRANLAEAFFSEIIKRYEGTRLGRQELNAELLEDNPNALWSRAMFDQHRVAPKDVPEMARVVIGVDPSASSNEKSDEAGIIVAGLGVDGHGYVFDDFTKIYTPLGWSRTAVNLYHTRHADRIVAEVNNGGDMVEATIRGVDENVAYKAVHATRGKAIRAEPVSALYEQGRVHHVGFFAKLEDECCDFNPILKAQASPNRMDALVWAMFELFGLTEQSTTSFLQFIDNDRAKYQAPREDADVVPTNEPRAAKKKWDGWH